MHLTPLQNKTVKYCVNNIDQHYGYGAMVMTGLYLCFFNIAVGNLFINVFIIKSSNGK